MSEWQPIETAPKDGARILILAKRSPRFVTLPEILWIKIGSWRGDYRDEGECWREDAVALINPFPSRLAPTHWMPLPDPPKAP